MTQEYCHLLGANVAGVGSDKPCHSTRAKLACVDARQPDNDALAPLTGARLRNFARRAVATRRAVGRAAVPTRRIMRDRNAAGAFDGCL